MAYIVKIDGKRLCPRIFTQIYQIYIRKALSENVNIEIDKFLAINKLIVYVQMI